MIQPWRALAGLALVVGIVACGGGETDQAPRGRAGAPRPVVRIGVLPERNVFRQLERFEPLAVYLSERAAVRVELRVLRRYGNIIGNFNSMGLHGAFFGSFTYALAHETLGLEPLARPMGSDGGSTYYGLIFARRDSRIRSAAEMKGKRFAFVDKATTAGYLLPVHYFHRNGVRDYASYLGEVYFAGTHEAAVTDVLSGRADVGAAKSTVFKEMAARDPRVARDLVVLARSPDVPENGLAVLTTVPPEIRLALRNALLRMHLDPEGQAALRAIEAARFIATTDEDYKPVYDYARAVHLDLAHYKYDNQ